MPTLMRHVIKDDQASTRYMINQVSFACGSRYDRKHERLPHLHRANEQGRRLANRRETFGEHLRRKRNLASSQVVEISSSSHTLIAVEFDLEVDWLDEAGP